MARWILSLLISVGLSAADAQWHASGNDGWSSDLSPYPESYPEVSPYGERQEVHPYGNRPDAGSRDSEQSQNTPSRPISSREDKFIKEREGQERTPSTHSDAAPKETGSRQTHEQTHGDWGIGRPNPRPNNRRRSQDSSNKKSPNAVETRRETLDIGFDEKEKEELQKYETGHTATGNNAAGFPGHIVDSSSDSNQRVVGSEIIPPGAKTAFDSTGTETTTPSTHYASNFEKKAIHSPAKRFPGPGYWQHRRYTQRITPTTTTTTTTPAPHDVYEPNLFHSAPEHPEPQSTNRYHNQYNGGSGGSPVRQGEHHEPVLRAHRLPNPIRNSHPRPYDPSRLQQHNNRPTSNSPGSNIHKTISHAGPQQRPRFDPTKRFHPNPREEQINRRGNVSPFNRHRSNSIHDYDFKKGSSYRPRPFSPKNTHPEAAASDSYHVNTPSHPTDQFFPHNSHPEATESGIYQSDRLQHRPRPFAPQNTHSEAAESDSYHVNRPSHRGSGNQFPPQNSQPEAPESGSYHANRLSLRPRPFFRQDPQPVAPEAESDSYNVKRPSRMSSYPNGEFVEPFRPSHSVSRPRWESHNAKRVSSTNSHFGQGNHFNRVAASRQPNPKSFSSSFTDTPNRFNKRPSTTNFYPGRAHPEGANRRVSTRRPAISNRFSPNGNHRSEEQRRPNRLFGGRPTSVNPNGRPRFNRPNTISSRNLNRESFANTGRIIYPVKPGPIHGGQFNRANRYLGRNKNRESISHPRPFSRRKNQPAPVFNRPNRFPSVSPSQESMSDAATGFSPLQTGREAGFNNPNRFSTWSKNSGDTRRFNHFSQRSNRGKPIVNRPNIPSVESLRPKSFYSDERVNPQNRFYPMDIQRETENIVDTPSDWDSYSNSRINRQVSPFEFDILEDPFEESFY